MINMNTPSDLGNTYYNRYSGAVPDHREAYAVGVSMRIDVDLRDDLDAIAEHFGISRSALVSDLLIIGLRAFQEQYARRCFAEGDAKTLQGLIDARGQKGLTAEGIFDRIRDGQEGK